MTSSSTPQIGGILAIDKPQLDMLLDQLHQNGFETLGPRVIDGALTYGPIGTVEDLPRGQSSIQAPGSFKMGGSGSDRYFDAIPGADSWKKYLFTPHQPLFETTRENGHITLAFPDVPAPLQAFIGVRGCELAAIQVQDRVFLGGPAKDADYNRRRTASFIVAVDCAFPAATCFCTSMETGPQVSSGFDLALTELDDKFLLRVGSTAGERIAANLEYDPATPAQLEAAETQVETAKACLQRQLRAEGLRDLLLANLTAARWDEVAQRCLNCTSCTLVCPTCFCWDVRDVTQLNGKHSERVRFWDSCCNPEHSYHAGGGSTRPDVKSRYRQWLTHKLGSWWDQFGVSGCVGCGRCITWCPAGIDITEEAAALRAEALA
jgi:ferredoxin